MKLSRIEPKIKNIKVHNYKLLRNSRQNDKLEQWAMHRTVGSTPEDDFLGSILGCQVKKFFSLFNILYYTNKTILSVSIMIISQLESKTIQTKLKRLEL